MASHHQEPPADFHAYWQELLQELASLPPAPEVNDMPIRSTDYADCYDVRLTSVGPYRIFAYLSIPRGQGPFPARCYLPRYASVVEPIPQGAPNGLRARYVTLSVGVRGQRMASQPYTADIPGLLTEGIDDSHRYVFRGIVADCCRGMEYLLSRPEVDPARIVAIGNDLAFITAALAPGVTHLVCNPGLFYRAAELAPATSAYPLEEFNDYLRLYPDKREAVQGVLRRFDLRWFAPQVQASTLLAEASFGGPMNAEVLAPLSQLIGGHAELRATEHSSYKDGLYAEEWITRQLGFSEPVLPEHWQT